MPVTGGPVTILCDAPSARGGTWLASGVIVFAPTNASALMQVPESGGAVTPATTLEGTEMSHRWPHALPNGRGILFTATSLIAGPFDAAHLAVVPSSGGPSKKVLENATFGRYVDTGHLVYVNGGSVFGALFDLQTLSVTGAAVPLVDRVSYESNTGLAQLDVNQAGTLVYTAGTEAEAGAEMAWLDRQGQTAMLRSTRTAWNNPRVSPDGRRLAIDIGSRTSRDIWIYDIGRDVATRVTNAGSDNAMSLWSPDGRVVAFRSNQNAGAQRTVFVQRSDGSGAAVALTDGRVSSTPHSWHPDGLHLVISQSLPGQFSDLMLLTLRASSSGDLAPVTLEPLLATPASETNARFSPDGRWLAYSSDTSGRSEIYVTPFPALGARWQVSSSGGSAVEWVKDRAELVYGAQVGEKFIVAYEAKGDTFTPGRATAWPASTQNPFALGRGWALSPDGNRLIIEPAASLAGAVDRVTVVTGLSEELRGKARQP